MALILDGTSGITAPNDVSVVGGTVTASTPLHDDTQTWNNGAVTFTAKKTNITDTASASGSLLEDWQVGGVSKVSIRKDGAVLVSDGTVSAPGIAFGSDTNTGIYRIGADNIAIACGASKAADFKANNSALGGLSPTAFITGTTLELGNKGNGLWNNLSGDDMRIMSNLYNDGTYRVAVTGYGCLYVMNSGTHLFYVSSSSASAGAATTIVAACGTNGNDIVNGANTTASAFFAQKTNVPGRSINCAGTVNASGADYAEYEAKNASCGPVAKGQIIGFDVFGKVTDKWAEAKSFGVKSTNPSYVGGDVWGSPEAIGQDKPQRPSVPAPLDGAEETTPEQRTQYAADLAAYELALERFDAALEAARQRVDRIAYSGKVPVNGIANPQVGDYIIPVQVGDGIGGISVTEPTFDQYRKAVGQVRRILPDGRPEIAVKVG